MKVLKIILVILLFVLIILGIDFVFREEEILNISTVETKYVGTVVIDPGHGGYDEGASSKKGNNEKSLVLEISLKLGKKLTENNFKVFYTRDKDISLGHTVREDIINRAEFIDSKKPDIFISIHLNGSDIKQAKGVESYYEYLNKKSYNLCENIQDELSSIEYTKDRGIKGTNEKSLGILRYSKAVGVLLELGFITNVEDEKYLVSNNGQDIIVEAIFNGIMNYFRNNNSGGYYEKN